MNALPQYLCPVYCTIIQPILQTKPIQKIDSAFKSYLQMIYPYAELIPTIKYSTSLYIKRGKNFNPKICLEFRRLTKRSNPK